MGTDFYDRHDMEYNKTRKIGNPYIMSNLRRFHDEIIKCNLYGTLYESLGKPKK